MGRLLVAIIQLSHIFGEAAKSSGDEKPARCDWRDDCGVGKEQ